MLEAILNSEIKKIWEHKRQIEKNLRQNNGILFFFKNMLLTTNDHLFTFVKKFGEFLNVTFPNKKEIYTRNS